jgi:hypothetical protein
VTGTVGGAVVLVGVLAQVALPRIAASRVKDRVGKYGSVESARVSAWPAVKLLWGDADSVTVRARNLKLSPEQTVKLLREARGVKRMEITSAAAEEGSLRLSDVSFSKRGDALSARARVTSADVRAALPEGFEVKLVKSEGGRVEVTASGGLFGVGASVDAVAGAEDGKLVAHPTSLLLGGFQLTLFSDPHVYVEGVGASVAAGTQAQPRAYLLSMSASLR